MACKEYYQSRRQMLKSTLGAAAGATLLGMPVRNLFSAAGQSHTASAKHVILFWNGGGMSHVDTWEPKPGTTAYHRRSQKSKFLVRRRISPAMDQVTRTHSHLTM